jgi:hypothetical protein
VMRAWPRISLTRRDNLSVRAEAIDEIRKWGLRTGSKKVWADLSRS